jgi:hypothetical protein
LPSDLDSLATFPPSPRTRTYQTYRSRTPPLSSAPTSSTEATEPDRYRGQYPQRLGFELEQAALNWRRAEVQIQGEGASVEIGVGGGEVRSATGMNEGSPYV